MVMKKKFTILLLITALALPSVAQMAVLGDMNIKGAQMKSVNEVSVSASTASAVGGRILNSGTLSIPGGITFVSTFFADGMLTNTGSGTVTMPADYTKVRVLKRGIDKTKWHYISFPFKVDISAAGLLAANPEIPAFYFQYYDVQKRANTGLTSGNWTYIAGNVTTLDPMVGYVFGVDQDATTDSVYFHPADATSMSALYSATQTLPVTYTKTETVMTELSEGWVASGTPYTARYILNTNGSGSAGTGNFNAHAYYFGGFSESANGKYYNDILGALGDDFVVPPFRITFFKMQSDAAGQSVVFSQNYTTVTSNLSNPRSADAPYEVLNLKLTGERPAIDEDRSILSFDDKYSENISMMDGPKMYSASDDVSEMWFNIKGEELYAAYLPKKTEREIPLTVKTGIAGDFTIGLSNNYYGDYSTIQLTDKYLNKITDLLTEDYSFAATKETTSDRFSLFVSKVSTGIDLPDGSVVNIYAKDKIVYVNGLLPGSLVSVYNTTGSLVSKVVSQGDNVSLPINQQGIYIVSVTGDNSATKKVIVH